MSYMALYRKFRPSTFDEVKGQDHIVTTLRNQLRTGRIGHAYLFCGTRGTGKTSVAKLLAKAVNCTSPDNGNPCGECENCKEIAQGNSMDVIEIDAASNNGVDNIRDIKEQVQYSPSTGRYKVYIIDEVHMLSIGAFNALLKTLEEPPEYVIFILATTEVHKIPITILSRCQRYDFHRITSATIEKRLRELMEEEQVEVEQQALSYIAKMADGSMRDALSLLDQCIAFYLGKKLTYDNVLEVLGTVDTSVYQELLGCVQSQNILGVMNILEKVMEQGRELTQFITDFIWYLRNLMLVGTSDVACEALEVSKEQLILMQEEAKKIDDATLIRYIRILSELLNQLRFATTKRVLVEVAFIKLCKPQMEVDQSSVLERIRQLESSLDKLQRQGIQPAVSQPQVNVVEIPAKSSEITKEDLEEKFPKAQVEELYQVVKNWKNIKRELPVILRDFLSQGKLSVDESTNSLLLLYPPEGKMGKDYLARNPEKLQEVEQRLSKQVGKEIKIEVAEATQRKEENIINLECIHMDVTIEE
ncbi:MAG: DNA polymerase III subunit gamma/tau [Anaerostipes sp.]|jgi:DNA polymerase-3 subunit gamma/tau